MLRVTDAPAQVPLPSRTLEPCPVKLNQNQDASSGMEGQVEERCLEQVQTMVVGEVLKDVDTACKLLNIASGRNSASVNGPILYPFSDFPSQTQASNLLSKEVCRKQHV